MNIQKISEINVNVAELLSEMLGDITLERELKIQGEIRRLGSALMRAAIS